MLLDELKKTSTIVNTKGGKYFETSYSSNLDLFAGISRYNDKEEIKALFDASYNESRELALKNLLYILDIRGGKGERRLFKILFEALIDINVGDAIIILNLIGELGRWDYTLVALKTKLEDFLIELLKNQINEDIKSEFPSLLGKWLPSIRCHKKTNFDAIYLAKKLGLSEKKYRIILKDLRCKINIVEALISKGLYSSIDYNKVPAKAALRYNNLFNTKDSDRFNSYKEDLFKGEAKINTKGLFPHEIIKRCYTKNIDKPMIDLMWKNQERVFNTNKNILVMADTSGSMMCYNGLPFYASIALAIYTAENNSGIFKNHFLTFSTHPKLQEIKGSTILDKVNNIKCIVDSTNIDNAFKLLLDTAQNANLSDSDMPSHIIIISDMEFDDGVYSKGGTNLNGWRKAFKEGGYTLPKIVFWNVAGRTGGLPTTKFDNDVVMVSGFSLSILSSLLDLEDYNPISEMLKVLEKYDKYIN